MAFQDSVKGAMRSMTIQVAAALAVIANVLPYVPDNWQQQLIAAGVAPKTVQVVGSIFAIVMIALRAKTTTSLAQRSAPAVQSPPTS